MQYLFWKEEKLKDFSSENITNMYENGYVFTRIDKGIMHQTRSLRLNLDKFHISSENRRILKKIDNLEIKKIDLPIDNYDFSIGKMAKDFYEKKFGQKIMSAQKIKEMLTNNDKSNFNLLLQYINTDQMIFGYTICYSNDSIIHYSYPFYNLEQCPKDMGLIMMINTIKSIKESGLKYVYLGSLQRPTDTYKLQFSGLEWFDGKKWQTDLNEAKKIINPTINQDQNNKVQ